MARDADLFERLRNMGEEAPRLHIITSGAGTDLQRAAWLLDALWRLVTGASFAGSAATEEYAVTA